MRKNIADIKNNRLKGLKLKLLIYDLNVEYLPGKYIYIADLLSRNYIDTRVNDGPLMKDVIHTITTPTMRFRNEKLTEIQL